MPAQDRRHDGRESNSRTRRQLLAVLGTSGIAALAGCSKDSGGGNPTDPQPATGAGTSSDGSTAGIKPSSSACTRITDGYTTFDPGKSRLVFSADIPQVFQGDVTITQRGQLLTAKKKLTRLKQFNLRIEQGAYFQPPTNMISTIPDGFEKVDEVTFNGEKRWVAKGVGFSAMESSPTLRVLLPYTVDGGKKVYIRTIISISFRAPTRSPTDACHAALDEAVLHVANSLEPNPESTIGEFIEPV